MILIIFISIIVIFGILFILFKKYSKQYWFNVARKMGEKEFYNGESFRNGAIIEADINKLNVNEIVDLYKNYIPSFTIDESKIRNFFSIMEKPALVYKREVKLVGAVFNSINRVFYNNNVFFVNFVDCSVVEKSMRKKNVFEGIMNEVSVYTNKNQAKLLFFKIDLKPVPSFPDYNFISTYYIGKKVNMGKINSGVKVENIDEKCYVGICSFLKKKCKIYPVLDKNSSFGKILINNGERITFIVGDKVIFNLRYNSKDYLEIMYVLCLEENDELVRDGIRYINNELNFRNLLIDSIGYNKRVIEIMGDYFNKHHITYHYMLGVKDKIMEDEMYYYF